MRTGCHVFVRLVSLTIGWVAIIGAPIAASAQVTPGPPQAEVWIVVLVHDSVWAQPIARARATGIEGSSGVRHTGLTDLTGMLRLGPILPREIAIQVTALGYKAASIQHQLLAGTDSLRIKLAPNRTSEQVIVVAGWNDEPSDPMDATDSVAIISAIAASVAGSVEGRGGLPRTAIARASNGWGDLLVIALKRIAPLATIDSIRATPEVPQLQIAFVRRNGDSATVGMVWSECLDDHRTRDSAYLYWLVRATSGGWFLLDRQLRLLGSGRCVFGG